MSEIPAVLSKARSTDTGVPDDSLRHKLLDRRRRLAAPGLAGHSDVADLLSEVDAALDRLERGKFGECERCHDPIEPERLVADPLTRVCLECLSPDQARALERDLETAAVIQKGLLPVEQIEVDGWQIRYTYRPLGPVSGDHCDVLVPSSESEPLHFLLGDVSGKGVSASLLMSHLHAIFRSLVPLGSGLEALLGHANRLFTESTLSNAYATLVAGRLGPSGTLELVNAGHCSPLLVRAGGVSELRSNGFPLGFFSRSNYQVERFELAPGELLLLYTDGLSEASNPAGEHYGVERLRGAVSRLHDLAPELAIRSCLEDLQAFRGGAPLEDDLTLMAIRRSGR